MAHDVFISYRRTELIYAQCLMFALTKLGYSVFLDQQGIGRGSFVEAIEAAIRDCKDFIVIINEASMKRLMDDENRKGDDRHDNGLPSDFLKEEVSAALHTKSNIIPIAPQRFAYPDNLPRPVSKLREIQTTYYNPEELFDQHFINDVKAKLVSKPKPQLGGKIIIALASVTLTAILTFGLSRGLQPGGEVPAPTGNPPIEGVAPADSSTPAQAEPQGLPYFHIYKDNQAAENHDDSIAYMGAIRGGDDGSIAINPASTGAPKSGDTCLEIRYTPKNPAHWAGSMWVLGQYDVSPNPSAGDAGTFKASKLTFWAKGTGAARFFIESDTGDQVTKDVHLGDEWTQYTLEVKKTWAAVRVGFGWSGNYNDANGEQMTILLDEIRFE